MIVMGEGPALATLLPAGVSITTVGALVAVAGAAVTVGAGVDRRGGFKNG